MKKRLMVLVMVAALFIGIFSVSAYADELQISKKLVDSNSWTNVGSAKKVSSPAAYSYATIKITALYKADGSTSDYKKLKVSTYASETWILTKGTTYDKGLPSTECKKDKVITYYCMGNNPELDCKASGYFNSH